MDNLIEWLKKTLTDLHYWPEFVKDGENVIFIVQDNDAFCRRIILKEVISMPVAKEGFILKNCSIEKKDNLYCMKGVLEEPIDEICEEFSLYFTDAEEFVQVYNCINGNLFYENPWRYIQEIKKCASSY